MTAVGVAGLAAFLVREPRGRADAAAVDLRRRQFAATNAVTFIVYAALTGATFLLPVGPGRVGLFAARLRVSRCCR